MERETHIQLDRIEQMITYLYSREKELEEIEKEDQEEDEYNNEEEETEQKIKTSVKNKKSEIVDNDEEE